MNPGDDERPAPTLDSLPMPGLPDPEPVECVHYDNGEAVLFADASRILFIRGVTLQELAPQLVGPVLYTRVDHRGFIFDLTGARGVGIAYGEAPHRNLILALGAIGSGARRRFWNDLIVMIGQREQQLAAQRN